MSIRSIKNQAVMTGKLVAMHSKWLLASERQATSHWDGKVHASMVGGCPTAAALQICGFGQTEVVDNVKGLRIFHLGKAIHDMLQREFVACGAIGLNEDGQPNIEVGLSLAMKDGGEIIGHADGLLEPTVYGEPAVMEAKSINSNALRNLVEPKEEHKVQAGIYSLALGVKIVVFIYYGKDTSEIREMVYRVTPADMANAEKRYTKIVALLKAWYDHQVFPEPEYDKPSQAPCSWCKWARVCHSTFDRQTFIDKCRSEHEETKKSIKALTPKGGKAKGTRNGAKRLRLHKPRR